MSEMATAERSPSPPLSEPPQLTLQPGPRAQKFGTVFNEALTHTLRTCSYAHFSACFPTPAQYNQPLLESVHRQIVSMVESRSRKEFDEILIERDVIRSLGELERLVQEATDRKAAGENDAQQTPAHLLSPEKLYDAYLAPYLVQAQQQLEQEAQALQEENERLALQIEGQREEVGGLVDGLERVIRDVEAANETMNAVLDVKEPVSHVVTPGRLPKTIR